MRWLRTLVLPVVAVALATAITTAIRPYFGAAPFGLMFLAILASAALGGTAAGWTAVGLSLVAAATLLVDPALSASAVPTLVTLLAPGIVGGAIVLLVDRLHKGVARGHARRREIERLNRLYDALSQVNQAIVWSPTRDELFRKVCQVLVERGGFRMAWIGWHDAETRRLVPVADWGDEHGYLRGIDVFADERPEGRGPAGVAFREGRAYVANDFGGDPATRPWRASAERHDLHAAAVFPIRLSGSVCGVLSVYAAEVGFFQAREVALLEEAAGNVSFALDNFAREQSRREAEAAAVRERQMVDTIFDSVPGVIYLYDVEGRFLRWNQNFLAVSGYTAEELAGMHPLDFFRGGDIPRVREAIGRVFDSGESAIEAGFVAKDGRAVPYYFTGRRITLDGRPCLVGMGSEISDRVEAEASLRRSEERYHSTLDSMMEGGQLIGFDWRYLYVNDAAARHNRRPIAEVLGRTVSECWPGIEATPVYAMFRRCLEERVAQHQEIQFTFPDGSGAWFDVRVQPVPEGLFVLSIDVTDRHRAEIALLEAKANLERQVAERTAELQAALVRAEAADRIKSAFLATMSHELRTPLNSILGFTGIVLRGLAGPLTAEQRKQLGMVKCSARHLLDLINDVLDISKIEAGQLTIRAESFDLGASVDQTVASVRPMADHKHLSLEVTMPASLPPMCSDGRRVEQILLNLLHNAVKFTERGRVGLTVEAGASVAVATGRPAVRISVADTGIGIMPEDLRTLFQPFRQVDTGLTRQHEGTGLGLAICRRLTELLGGEIGAESTFGAGSTFTVTLPLDQEP